MMAVRIIVEGEDAESAAKGLAATSGISVEVRVPEPRFGEKEPATVLVAIATIVGAAGGVAAIVDSVLSWRDRLKKRSSELRIIIETGGVRHPLNEIDRDELTYLVEVDHDTDV
jgi:hypothetical protein